MLVLGIILGWRFSKRLVIDVWWGIGILIFIMASLVFWMLPHSVDLAVIRPSFNRIMHVNMLIAGFLLLPVLRSTIFEAKIIFCGMVSAMLIATGITLTSFDILLCSAFNIEQQKDTGFWLLIAGLAFFAGTIYIFFRGIGGK